MPDVLFAWLSILAGALSLAGFFYLLLRRPKCWKCGARACEPYGKFDQEPLYRCESCGYVTAISSRDLK